MAAVDLMAQRCADLFHHGPFESLPTAGEGRVSKGPGLLSAGKSPVSGQKRKLCTGKHSEANTSASRCNCSNRRWSFVAAAIIVVACLATSADAAGSFYEDFEVVWGEDPHPERRVAVIDGGRLVKLTLDKVSGSGFQSKDAFLFGEFTMQMKLVPGDSAGTVTTFYLSSKDYPMWEGDGHDEIDFEFLGNVSGEPYVMQTNVFARGVGNREQRFFLWFDPTADFHNYTILWNPLNIIFSVDGVAVRVFKNHELQGVPYLSGQAMKARASIWDGESWVTMGGRVKTDWSHAPFVASYGAYDASTACVSSCSPAPWMTRRLGPEEQRALAWARDNYMVMDYCDDPWKVFPRGVPAECGIDRLARLL